MSCWVVAALAAEVLGISVPQVLERAKSGSIPSKTDLGFLMVDVAPGSPRMEAGTMTPGRRPQTFTPIPKEQLQEPSAPRVRALPLGPRLAPVPEPEVTLDPEEELALSAEVDGNKPSRFDMSDWRRTRLATSRSRVRPGTARAA